MGRLIPPDVRAACLRVITIWDEPRFELPKILIRLVRLHPDKFEVLRAAWVPFIEAGDLVGEKALLGALLLDGDFGLEPSSIKDLTADFLKRGQAFFASMFGGWWSQTQHLKDE